VQRSGSSIPPARTCVARSRLTTRSPATGRTWCSRTSGTRLVRMALALMRAEVWGTGNHLHRVAIRYADARIGALVAVAHGRLVITGASGHRLHEQLIFAWVRLGGPRPERLGVEARRGSVAAMKLRDEQLRRSASSPAAALAELAELDELDELAHRRRDQRDSSA
jgi:hypothetical protein